MTSGRRSKENRRPALIIGDGIAASMDVPFEVTAHGRLAEKRPGCHRWVAVAAYNVGGDDAAKAFDPAAKKYLDNENLFMLAIGCYDCERTLVEVGWDSPCPAEVSA